MLKTSITTITKGQEKQIKRFAEDAIDRAVSKGFLDKNGIQKLIENGDQFQDDMIASIKKHSMTNQFADEETESEYGYFSGYRKPNHIEDQIARLRELFFDVDLGTAHLELTDQPNPQSVDVSEGQFAIPDWHLIAAGYPEAVQKVLDLIKDSRDFFNYRESQIYEGRLRQSERSERGWAAINDSQPGHIKIIHAQLGFRYRGYSVRRALEIMSPREFGLGAYAIGIILLTHPERLRHDNDLYIDCAGDEFSDDGDGVFDGAPCWAFDDDEVGFGACYIGDYGDNYGSASGFLPQ